MIAPSIRHRTAARGRRDRWLALITVTVALASLPAIVRIVRTIPLRVSLDTNEGWNAYQAVAAFAGDLYPHAPRLFFNNYPPLSFYLVGLAGRWIGDPIVAGRLIACAAFAALAVILGLVARQMRCTRGEAAFAAALFVATTLSLSHYVGVDDPQFLGQAVATASLLFVIPEPRTLRRLWLAAALMSAGIFIKHNVVALPIACIVWLWMHDRVAARRLVTAGASFAVAGLSLCVWMYGAGFLEGLATPRGYSTAVAARAFIRWIVRVPVFAAALVVCLRRFPRDRDVAFCAWYAGIASGVGLVFLGGDGVDWNVMFESNWAWCLTAAVALRACEGITSNAKTAKTAKTNCPMIPLRALRPLRSDVFFHELLNRLRRSTLAVAFALLPLVAAALAVHRASVDPASSLASRMAGASAFEDDIAFVASRRGPALCEDLALCFWAGKPPEVDVVNLEQHVRRGTRRADELVRLIDRRYYAVVQLNAGHSLLDGTARDALQRSYVLARQSQAGMLFVP
ncbi:MAG: hypothetical protein AUH43_08830 [Acidobacteria bacterium 13_1_40CM_65_14]|nr:MAG: hypothetical protein AUH43_08830 [Acidobacteria bacterium 13_1_40CM_65_14]